MVIHYLPPKAGLIRALSSVVLYLLLSCVALGQAHAAELPDLQWRGPQSGPVAQVGKRIVFVSQDSANGGISLLYRNFQVASEVLGWKVRYIDGKNDLPRIKAALLKAAQSSADAVVLGGISARSVAEEVNQLKNAGKIVVGWHAAAEPGPTDGLYINIATRSQDVAGMAANYVVQHSKGPVGVVIFNDSRFEVANAKTDDMRKIIAQCDRCRVLAVEDINLGNTITEVPKAVNRLLDKFGKAWTHSLAINDLYFDSINFPLRARGRSDIQNISAGDGSSRALNRIRSGLSTQVATIAEPVSLQGWQLADELNRALAGAPPSGVQSLPILVTYKLANKLNIYDLDQSIPYKRWYKAIWAGHPEDIPK